MAVAVEGATSTKTKGRRGRKQDDSLPPSRSRDMQRAFRARKAQHVTDLENRIARLEAENKELRDRLGMPARLPTPPHSTSPPSVGGGGGGGGGMSSSGRDHAGEAEAEAETPSEAGDGLDASPAANANLNWVHTASSSNSASAMSPVRSPLPPTPAIENTRMAFPPITSAPLSHSYPPAPPIQPQPLDMLAHVASPTLGRFPQPGLPHAQSSSFFPPNAYTSPAHSSYPSYGSQSHSNNQVPVLAPISIPQQHQPPAFRPMQAGPEQGQYATYQQQQQPKLWHLQQLQQYYPGHSHHNGHMSIQSSDPAAHAHASAAPSSSSASAMMCRPTEDCCPAPPIRNEQPSHLSPISPLTSGYDHSQSQRLLVPSQHLQTYSSPSSNGVMSSSTIESDNVADAEAAAATLTTLTTLESLIPYEPRLLPARPPSPSPSLEAHFLTLYAPDATSEPAPNYRSFVLALMRGLELTNKGPCARLSFTAEEEMQLCTPAGETCCGGLLDCAAASVVAAQADLDLELSSARGSLRVLERREGWMRPREVWNALGPPAFVGLYNEERKEDRENEDEREGESRARRLAEIVLDHGRPEGEQIGLVSRNVRCETRCGLVVAEEIVRSLLLRESDRRENGQGAGLMSRVKEEFGLEPEFEGSGGGRPRKKVCCGPNRTC